jgi:DNA polymerase-2
MRGWLLDAYRVGNCLALWLKTDRGDTRITLPYTAHVLVTDTPEARVLLRFSDFVEQERPDVYGGTVRVLRVRVPQLSSYERYVRELEQLARYRIPLFDADIPPEQRFFYEQHLYPGCFVQYDEQSGTLTQEAHSAPLLKTMDLRVVLTPDGKTIKAITFGSQLFMGEESLAAFAASFAREDPDVIVAERAFSRIALLDAKFQEHSIVSPLHRFDPAPIRSRGGKSFWSYGQVRYQDFSVHLHGRLLVDTTTMVGSSRVECILELAELSGARLQTVAARSFGAVFQASLVRELVQANVAIPYKEKPIEKPLSIRALLAADRTGQILDPVVGFHQDVAEIDFTSMYPFLIHRHNLSAETILSATPDDEQAPGIDIFIKQPRHEYSQQQHPHQYLQQTHSPQHSQQRPQQHFQQHPQQHSQQRSQQYSQQHRPGSLGLVPRAIEPFLKRRLFYKRNPSPQHAIRAAALKMVLVTSYGYLRFREFKLGVPSSHMAIGAYARETLAWGVQRARESGFRVLHGIVDSLYLATPRTEQSISAEQVQTLCRELEEHSGLPIAFEGIFSWIVFLPSIRDEKKPVPMRYYGVFKTGEVKLRGVMARKRSTPQLVKEFQLACLERFATHTDERGVKQEIPGCAQLLKTYCARAQHAASHELASRIRISTTHYKTRTAQARVLAALTQRGARIEPGQTVSVVYTQRGPVPAEHHNSTRNAVDNEFYTQQLLRALFELVQPFGYTRAQLTSLLCGQRTLPEFAQRIVVRSIAVRELPAQRRGFSERVVKRHLIRRGWRVLRGGALARALQPEQYPVVKAAYERLRVCVEAARPGAWDELRLLCAVHHGMPDFVCVRGTDTLFVESKLGGEALSEQQKRCVHAVQSLGFRVEVHRVVTHAGARVAVRDLARPRSKAQVIDKQLVLTRLAH